MRTGDPACFDAYLRSSGSGARAAAEIRTCGNLKGSADGLGCSGADRVLRMPVASASQLNSEGQQ